MVLLQSAVLRQLNAPCAIHAVGDKKKKRLIEVSGDHFVRSVC